MAPTLLLAPPVAATALEVLPAFGLAYLQDDEHRTWTVTRSTPGPGLAQLHAGQRCKLTLAKHGAFTVVSRYTPMP